MSREQLAVTLKALGGYSSDQVFDIPTLLQQHKERTLPLTDYPFVLDLILDKVKDIADLSEDLRTNHDKQVENLQTIVKALVKKLPDRARAEWREATKGDNKWQG